MKNREAWLFRLHAREELKMKNDDFNELKTPNKKKTVRVWLKRMMAVGILLFTLILIYSVVATLVVKTSKEHVLKPLKNLVQSQNVQQVKQQVELTEFAHFDALLTNTRYTVIGTVTGGRGPDSSGYSLVNLYNPKELHDSRNSVYMSPSFPITNQVASQIKDYTKIETSFVTDDKGDIAKVLSTKILEPIDSEAVKYDELEKEVAAKQQALEQQTFEKEKDKLNQALSTIQDNLVQSIACSSSDVLYGRTIQFTLNPNFLKLSALTQEVVLKKIDAELELPKALRKIEQVSENIDVTASYTVLEVEVATSDFNGTITKTD